MSLSPTIIYLKKERKKKKKENKINNQKINKDIFN